MTFIVVPVAQLPRIRRALARLENLPRRATVVGGPDSLPATYSAGAGGWTDDVLDLDEGDGTTALVELPQRYEKHLGKTVTLPSGQTVTLPTLAELAADESALPTALRALRQARRAARAPALPDTPPVPAPEEPEEP